MLSSQPNSGRNGEQMSNPSPARDAAIAALEAQAPATAIAVIKDRARE